LVSEKASLSENAPLQANGQVPAGLARDRDKARLGGMLELAMASTCPAEHPAVLLDQLDGLADLHAVPSPRQVERSRAYRDKEQADQVITAPEVKI